MRHPNPEVLLRTAQADAYALAVEFVGPEHSDLVEQTLQVDRFRANPRYTYPAARYSDDTQMSIAVAEVMLTGDLDTPAFAEAFVRCYRRDPRDAYSRGMRDLLDASPTGAALLAQARQRPGSNRNGAAMRSVPLGILSDWLLASEAARLQARVTHDTPGGVRAAQAVALASHYAMHRDEPLSDLREWVAEKLRCHPDDFRWGGERVAGPCLGSATAAAVLTLCAEQPTLLDILRTAVRWGGDTDTVAATAWGIASARMREPVPTFLEEDLEPGSAFGVEFLRRLGTDLMSCVAARGEP